MSLATRLSALAQAIGLQIKSLWTAVNGKVDQVAGKGLSENDLTNLLKANYDDVYQFMQDMAGGLYYEGGNLIPDGVGTTNTFTLTAGRGWAMRPDGKKVLITWTQKTGVATQFNGTNYVGIDYNGNIVISPEPLTFEHIGCAFCQTTASNTIIIGYSNVKYQLGQVLNNIGRWARDVVGVLVENGCNLSLQAAPDNLKVILGSGRLYYEFSRYDIDDTTTFTRLFNSQQGYLPETTFAADTIPTGYWNDPSQPYITAVQPLAAGKFAKHLFFINPEGVLYMLYGTQQFDTLDAAKAGAEPAAPDSIKNSICRVASVIVQQGNSTVQALIDSRPILYRLFLTGIEATPLTTINHNDLTGLNIGDPHSQYLNIARGDARYSTRSEEDAIHALLAPLDSPALINNPTAPTPTAGDSSTRISTTQFVMLAVQQAITDLLDAAPGALDTLKELASALANDPNFATTIANQMAKRLRVDDVQIFSAPEQAQGRANLGMQNTPLVDTTTTANITDTAAKRFFSDVERTKLNGIADNANNYSHPNHSGDVVSTGDGATTIQPKAVTNAKMADMLAETIKVNLTDAPAEAQDADLFKFLQQVLTSIYIDDEDFVNGITGTNYTSTAAGTGAATSTQALNDPSAIGGIILTTGTTATGRAAVHKIRTSSIFASGAGNELISIIKFQIPTLSDATNGYDLCLGWGDVNTTFEFTDSPGYLQYAHDKNAGNFIYGTANNSTRTKVNSAITATVRTGTNWYYFMTITAADGSSTRFFLDGVEMGAAITTNIPTTLTRGFDYCAGIYKWIGNTARTVIIDRIVQLAKRADRANWRRPI